MSKPITDEDIANAWDRIARTADGQTAYLGLQKLLCGVLESNDPGALRENHGYRKFARDVMAKMARGIEESGGHTTESGRRPITFAIAQPRAVTGARRGAARRVADTEPGAESGSDS